MSETLVEVRGLCRSFGNLKAVDGVSFDLRRGQVAGFIGENGAGKTTTMRMLVTLDLPDAGTIRICGFDSLNHPNELRKRIGWMPDRYGTYDCMDVREYLDFFARAYGFIGKERDLRVAEVMEFTDLRPIANQAVNKLSKGQAQRLCLGRTLLPDPELLVLDEPAAGLDPRARIEVKNLVRLLAAEGKTLFISSHILSELEEMCDELLFISRGKLVHQGSSESLKSRGGTAALLRIRLAAEHPGFADWVSLQPGLELMEHSGVTARLRVAEADPDALSRLLARLVRDGFPVCGFERESVRLEDAFVEILRDRPEGVRP